MTALMDVLVVMLVIAPIPSIAATAYLWSVYLSDRARPRSWLLRMLATTSTVVSASVLYIGFLASYRLLGRGALPEEWVVVLSVDLLVLAYAPVYMAFRIWRAAHGGPRPTVPTNGAPTPRTRAGDGGS